MARVEWAALSGDEVESIVSNLLYNEFPRAQRVRPSQGDFGIDVLVPSTTEQGKHDVYQIKKFAINLTDNQKRQIKQSFKTLVVQLARKNLPIANWYLVMPLDPTAGNLFDWFDAVPDTVIADLEADAKLALTDPQKLAICEWRNAPGREFSWKGLLFCEGLASKYWFVPDYYIHGGAERIRAAVADVAKILYRDLSTPPQTSSDATAILQPKELHQHFERLQRTLDGDPHFRYGVSLDPTPPPLVDQPGLLAATQETTLDGSCITFRIFERFAEALHERPIPMNLQFEFEADSPHRKSFEEWLKYGKPMTVPAKFTADFPGGLGTVTAQEGIVQIRPTQENRFRSRFRVRKRDSTVTAEVAFCMSSTAWLQGTGLWAHGTDASGVLDIEALFDYQGTVDSTGAVTFTRHGISGRDATAVLPALEFLVELHSENVLEASGSHGPFVALGPLPDNQPMIPLTLLKYVQGLVSIQDYTSIPILIPEFESLSLDDVDGVFHAAALVTGHVLVGTWDEITWPGSPDYSPDPDAEYELRILRDLRVNLADRTVVLGAATSRLLSATIDRLPSGALRARPFRHNSAQQQFNPGIAAPALGEYPVACRQISGKDAGSSAT